METENEKRGSLGLIVVLLAVVFGFIAISGGDFWVFRIWPQQQSAIDADFNPPRP